MRRRKGGCLRTNLTENDPAQLWHYNTQLIAAEEAFRNQGRPRDSSGLRQDEKRIEALIFVAFLLTACGSRLSAACFGAWADRTQRAQQVRRRPDDRCPCAEHRWPRNPAHS